MSEGYEFDAALQEQAIRVGQESILKLLEGKTYQHGKVTEWTDKLTESCVNRIKELGPGLKVCVAAVVAQRSASGGGGGGLHSEWSVRMDPRTDGLCSVHWQNDTIVCDLTIVGLAV